MLVVKEYVRGVLYASKDNDTFVGIIADNERKKVKI